MPSLMLERSHFEVGFVPVADAFDTTAGTTDVINMNNHNRCRFVIFTGAGATGTFTPVVEACDNVTPSNVAAVPYKYRTTIAGTVGAIGTATASGFTSTAQANQIIEIEITAADLIASGYGYVRLKCTEVVNSPVLGGCLVELLEPRYPGATQPAAIT